MEGVDEIPILEFVEKRAKEMKMMLEVSQAVSGNDAPQQRLPRHMRRRAANHNIKRLPRTLRSKVAKDMLAIPKKRPSRRHRRRPSNLLLEYEKRSSSKRWLETHIWHAKRFHMAELWKCKIAERRNDRGVRAAYRDSRKESLIIDISWLQCFEIVGSETDIIRAMELFICNQTESSSVISDHHKGGRYEGETIFYKKGDNQNIPIANVKFLWRFDLEPRVKRSILIWVHPSSGNELLDHFKDALNISKVENNDNLLTNGTIDVIVRTKDFCRFKLIGPKSQSVLWSALKISDLECSYFNNFYKYNENEMSAVRAQHVNWCNLKSTDAVTFPSSGVHGLLVGDPRLNMPRKRIDSNHGGIFSNYNHPTFHHFDPQLSFSSIWNEDLMTKLKEVKLSTHAMNELRSGSLLTNYNPSIPILLLQNPGSTNSSGDPGYGSGWDVVIPRGWGMAFWLGLIYRGARSIGLEELKRINYEAAHLPFPDFYPDSKSGKEFQLTAYQRLSSKYERMPRSKRPHYKKLKVQTPFHCPWQELCDEWNAKASLHHVDQLNGNNEDIKTSDTKALEYFVIRDNKFLKEIDKSMRFKFQTEKSESSLKLPAGQIFRKVTVKGSSNCYFSVEKNGSKKMILDRSQMFLASPYVDRMMTSYSMGLVPVVVDVLERGSPEFSMICIPSAADVAAFVGDRRDITEPPGDISERTKYDTTSMQKASNIVDYCTRQTIGFSRAGGFAFFKGKGRIVGFVALPGIGRLYSDNAKHIKASDTTKKVPINLVLVRSSTSLYYHFATLKTLFDLPH